MRASRPGIEESLDMGVGFGCEPAKAERISRMADAGGVLFRGEGKAGGGVLALEDKALAQDLVSLRVRRALEHRIDLEVWLGVGHRGVNAGAVLKEEEVPKERGRMLPEAAFPVRGPDVLCVADGFLSYGSCSSL